jgi:hypothetical protein
VTGESASAVTGESASAVTGESASAVTGEVLSRIADCTRLTKARIVRTMRPQVGRRH